MGVSSRHGIFTYRCSKHGWLGLRLGNELIREWLGNYMLSQNICTLSKRIEWMLFGMYKHEDGCPNE